jgi:hypothetical protein
MNWKYMCLVAVLSGSFTSRRWVPSKAATARPTCKSAAVDAYPMGTFARHRSKTIAALAEFHKPGLAECPVDVADKKRREYRGCRML